MTDSLPSISLDRLTDASPSDARAMLEYCPTALIFGAWDSTGPRGGMGHKFQRTLVSEVVGIGHIAGTSVSNRIDPLQISAGVHLTIPKDDSDAWSVDDKGKSKQRPSEVNHSNIAPSRVEEAGGVTFEYAFHTAVLSLPALRRLRFEAFSSSPDETCSLYEAGLEHAGAVGVTWTEDDVMLQPMPKVVQLVRASQQLRAAGRADQD